MFPLIGGLLGGLGSLFGSVVSSNQSGQNTQATIAANQANQAEAEQFDEDERARSAQASQDSINQQEGFQQQMSSTAYQRASADMTAAGLNPMMMFGGGSAASTPSGGSIGQSAPTIQPMRSDYSQRTSALGGIGDAVKTAVSSATQAATIDNLIADNAKIKSQAINTDVDSRLKSVQAGETAERAGLEISSTRLNQASLPKVVNEAITAQNQSSIDPTTRKLLDQLGFTGQRADQILSPVSNLVSSAKQFQSMMPRRSTSETTSSNGYSTFNERWDNM